MRPSGLPLYNRKRGGCVKSPRHTLLNFFLEQLGECLGCLAGIYLHFGDWLVAEVLEAQKLGGNKLAILRDACLQLHVAHTYCRNGELADGCLHVLRGRREDVLQFSAILYGVLLFLHLKHAVGWLVNKFYSPTHEAFFHLDVVECHQILCHFQMIYLCHNNVSFSNLKLFCIYIIELFFS